jgi:hypothetical protein
METLQLALSEFTKRSRSVSVAHGSTTLERGLEPGEAVLIQDGGTFRIAEVADITFDLTDTHYRLELGRELNAAPVGHAVDTLELIALLREARRLHPSHATGPRRVRSTARG